MIKKIVPIFIAFTLLFLITVDLSFGASPSESYTWSPRIASDCRAMAAPEPDWIETPEGDDCTVYTIHPRPQLWLLSSTNEDENFTGGTMWDIPLSDPVWDYAFHKKPDGNYQVGWVLDKVNYDLYRNKYSFVGFNDNWDINDTIPKPNLGDNLFAKFNLGLFAEEHYWDSGVGDAKNRIMLGVGARWDGYIHFMEVNLYRTDNFDLCEDPQDLYDFCVYWFNPPWETRELVYYNGSNLGEVPGVDNDLPVLYPDGQMRYFNIPVSTLFKNYAWNQPPNSWEDATLAGVYIGIEIWGKGRVWMEFDDYQLYKEEIIECPNPPAKVGGSYYSTLQSAYDAAWNGAIIQSQAVDFTENLDIDLNKTVSLEAGYDCDYTAITGQTSINGEMRISNGTLRISSGTLRIAK